MDSTPPACPRKRSSFVLRAAFVLVLLLALALRLVGLEHGLPHSTEPDGLVIVTQAELLRSDAAEPERELLWGFYPHLVARLAALGELPAPRASTPGAELEAAARGYALARLVVALLSLLAVPGTYLLARRFLEPTWSLVAAGLAGSSTLVLWFAQQARPHAAAAALALLALVAALRLAERGRWSDVLLAALAAGLAVATLQFGVFVLPPIALALVLCRGRGWPWRASAGLVVLAHVALALLAFYPFLFAAGSAAGKLGAGGGEVQLSGHVIYSELFNGGGFAKVFAALCDYEPWIALWAALGLVVLLAAWLGGARLGGERGRALWIVLAYVLPFLLAIGLYQRTYQRFAIPLVPFLALLAAAGTSRLARTCVLRVALALLVLAVQVGLGARLAWLRAQPDTVAEAAQWIEMHLQPGQDRIFVLPSHDLPLAQDAEALAVNEKRMDAASRPWFRFQRALAPGERRGPGWKLFAMPFDTPERMRAAKEDGEAYLRGLEADWCVVEVYTGGRKPLVLAGIHPALERCAVRVARFSPERVDTGDDLPLTWSDDEYPRRECWALRLLGARALGPVVEVWRMRGGGDSLER